MKEGTEAQNMLALIDFLQANDVREARTRVRKRIASLKQYEQWSEEDREAASLVASTFDVAGMLVNHGIVPRDPFLDNWGPTIRACREILEPHIEEWRKPEHSGPTYWSDFDWLDKQVRQS